MHQPFDFCEALFFAPTGIAIEKVLRLDWLFSLPYMRHELKPYILCNTISDAEALLQGKQGWR